MRYKAKTTDIACVEKLLFSFYPIDILISVAIAKFKYPFIVDLK